MLLNPLAPRVSLSVPRPAGSSRTKLRRPTLFLSTFLVLALCFAAVAALVVAGVAAHSRGVSTSAWFTGTGLGDLVRELGDLALATIGYSVLGMALGQFVRSAVFAVIVGFAWLIAVENIITRIVPSTQQWLPGASILPAAARA